MLVLWNQQPARLAVVLELAGQPPVGSTEIHVELPSFEGNLLFASLAFPDSADLRKAELGDSNVNAEEVSKRAVPHQPTTPNSDMWQ